MPILIKPFLLQQTLAARHCEGLTRRQLQLLGAHEFGYSTEDMAPAFFIAEETVRRHLMELAHRVLDPVGLPATRGFLKKWTGLHYTCCTISILRLVEADQLFDRCDQPGQARPA